MGKGYRTYVVVCPLSSGIKRDRIAGAFVSILIPN